MGLIVIICMGFFFAVTAIVALVYILTVYATFTKLKIKSYGKIIITIFSSISAVYLFTVLLNFYNTNTEMIGLRGYLGLAPKFTDSLKIEDGDFSLSYIRHTNYNTGASGGINISEILSLVHNDKPKEIEILISEYTYTPYLASEYIEVKNKYEKGNYYVNLFIDPKVFNKNEFKLIGKLLVNNAERFEEILNYSYSFSSKPRNHYLSKIFYLNRTSLKRKFECKNDVIIHLIENGDVFAFSSRKESPFYTSVWNPQSVFARPNKIGKAINKEITLALSSKFDDVEIIDDLLEKQLRFKDTIIEKCYDETGHNIFNEFNLLIQGEQ